MKTNVSIKFNSIEEYREIEKKLEELGYKNVRWWDILEDEKFVHINDEYKFTALIYSYGKTYNSLEEFLKD